MPPRAKEAGLTGRRPRLRQQGHRISPPPAKPRPALERALKRVKLFLCDVDGVLTDGTVLIGNGTEFKTFHIHDGLGLRTLQRQGIRVGWISNRPSAATQQRAEELKVDFLFQRNDSKVEAVKLILAEAGLDWDEVCYLGDDIVDLGVLKRAGVAVAVANAVPEAKALADHVTEAAGGGGAVREVVELILKAQNKWTAVVREHLK